MHARGSAVVVVLGILAPAFSTFVTATVLPSVIAEIGGVALYAWASTAYAVASILGSAACSVVVRTVGMRATLVGAALVFGVGTSVCAIAPSMPVLIVGRGLQGLGAGMMIAGAHGVIREVFPEPLWPRMLATISGAWGAAALAGPAIGGFFAAAGGWRLAFWVLVPLTVVAAGLTLRILPAHTRSPEPRTRAPFERLVLICAGVLCIATLANVGSTSARVALVAGAAGAMTLAVRLDRAAPSRLFPLDMLALRHNVGKAFWMIFLIATATTPGGVFLPLLLQILHGVSPAVAGYLFAAQSLAWTTAALVGARAAGTHARVAIVLGPIMMIVGFAGLFATISSGPIVAIAVSVVLVGAGIGTCWAHVGTIMLRSVRQDEGALAGSLIPSTQLFAVSFGAAVAGIIANTAGLARGASDAAAALAGTWLFGAFALAPLLAFVIGLRLYPGAPLPGSPRPPDVRDDPSAARRDMDPRPRFRRRTG